MSDLDMSDVYADALNDPSLDRPCEEGTACTDSRCPLIHCEHDEVRQVSENDVECLNCGTVSA